MKKILLIHGWNYRNYTSQTNEKDAWHNRSELVKKLEEKYKVYKLNLPGFCGQQEPNEAWTLDNYADYISKYFNDNQIKVDYILGYSFGGAVAISYLLKYQNNEKLILISPAIIRNNDKSKKFIKTPKLFDKIRKILRDQYLIRVVKTPEMVYGTKFLRNTYQSIVREDLQESVLKIDKNDLLIIYGDEDKMVSPHIVFEHLPRTYQQRVKLIPGGGHNIGATHYNQIIEIIEKNI